MSDPGGRQRLDDLLVTRGLFASRSRARDAILRGTVSLDGSTVAKPGRTVSPDAELVVNDAARPYVSRSALKLTAGLDGFGFDPAGLDALDFGASTGGFTEVLLERGASHVTAIDVGRGQLHPRLAAHPRVTSLEGVNARDLDPAMLGGRVPRVVVCDLSFISLRLALLPALRVAVEGAFGVFLVKPQFEAGRNAIGKGGIVRNESIAASVAEDLVLWLGAQPGWRAVGLLPSPIDGSDGNREFLLGGRKGS